MSTPPTLADVTIMIPTVGRPILERALAAIAAGDRWPAAVAVVDQGENPAVQDWLLGLERRGLRTIHLPSTERSPATARNHGLQHITTPLVAAIDDDCLVAPDWLETAVRLLGERPDALISGRVEAAGPGTPPSTFRSPVAVEYRRPSVRIHCPLQTNNMAFALATARRIGPFDPNLIEAEDNDWSYRALKLGIPIHYRPELVVDHYHWRNPAQLAAVYRSYAWSQGVFYGKHLRRGDWSMAARTALSLFRGGRSLVRGLATNDRDKRLIGHGIMTQLMPGVVAGLRARGASGSRSG